MTTINPKNAMIPVWCGYTTTNEYGHLGPLYGVYRTEDDANVGVLGIGWYGSSGRVIKKWALEYGYDLYILDNTEPTCFNDVTERREELRQHKIATALGKLTEEEIQILRGEFK